MKGLKWWIILAYYLGVSLPKPASLRWMPCWETSGAPRLSAGTVITRMAPKRVNLIWRNSAIEMRKRDCHHWFLRVNPWTGVYVWQPSCVIFQQNVSFVHPIFLEIWSFSFSEYSMHKRKSSIWNSLCILYACIDMPMFHFFLDGFVCLFSWLIIHFFQQRLQF